jgi:isopenicillin-N epimerase
MKFSSLFLQDFSFSHLNAGSLTKTPLEIIEFLEKFRRDEELNPTKSLFLAPKIFARAQECVAKEFGAKAEDLFFRSNITSALNDFLFALHLEGEGEILCTSWDYGATENLAKVRAKEAGFSFDKIVLPIDAGLTIEEIENRILKRLNDKTKVLVISHIATGLGTVLPVASLVKKARENGIIVVIDGAHAPGAIPIDLEDIQADFYGGNLHKWFLGPRGTAFGWVNPKWRGKLLWKFGGWASFEVPSHYVGCLKDFEAAKRFFPGTMDSAPFAAIEPLMNFWDRNGRENLRKHQTSLRDLIEQKALEIGWKRLSPKENSGPLITFEIPKSWQGIKDLAYRLYTEAKVQVAVPNIGGTSVLRFSPGVYTRVEEIELGMRQLENWKK